jgi:hypothetical protein
MKKVIAIALFVLYYLISSMFFGLLPSLPVSARSGGRNAKQQHD